MKIYDIENKYPIEPCGSAYIKGKLIIGSVRVVKKKSYFIDRFGNAYGKWGSFKRHDISTNKKMHTKRMNILLNY